MKNKFVIVTISTKKQNINGVIRWKQYKKFRPQEFPGLPATITYGIDVDGSIQKQIAEGIFGLMLATSPVPCSTLWSTIARPMLATWPFSVC